jgi:hypothetical protein
MRTDTAQTTGDQGGLFLFFASLLSVVFLFLFLGFAAAGMDLWGCIVGFVWAITIIGGGIALILGGVVSKEFTTNVVDCRVPGVYVKGNYTGCVWANTTSSGSNNGFWDQWPGDGVACPRVFICMVKY